jgi:elongation factor Ts
MTISVAQIKELRELTGAGPLDCKNALASHGGDLEQAAAYLREKGLARAARVAGRETNAGLVIVGASADAAWAVEARCETDFVARTEAFKAWAHHVANLVGAGMTPTEPDALLTAEFPERPGVPLSAVMAELKGRLGENILVRAARFDLGPGAVVEGYVHAGDVKGDLGPGEGRVGVLVELVSDGSAAHRDALRRLAHELALQAAASGARYLIPADIPPAELEAEQQRLQDDVAAEQKPEPIAARIVAGRLAKYVEGVCLLPQLYLRDDSQTVEAWLTQQSAALGAPVMVRRLVRFAAGA